MLKKLISGRLGYIWGAIASWSLVGFGLYIQVQHNLDPCPLCIFQRIAFILLGLTFLIAVWYKPTGGWRTIYGGLQLFISTVGSGIAIRHIWIQSHAEEVIAECGAGFDYIFERFPFRKAVELVFKGTGECSSIDWTLAGFSIPQLSLIAFIGMAVYTVKLATMKD